MNNSVLVLLLLNLLLIGLLPRIFFKSDGKYNALWWLTAAPYFLCAVFLVLSYQQIWPRWGVLPWRWWAVTDGLAVFLSALSVFLIAFTLGTHRQRIALWHQTNDAPQHIVTYGAYSRIRHPFYASFQLTLIAAFVFCPQWGTLLVLIYGLIVMNQTAAKEEKRLSQSAFGDEYQAYMKRTGRFFPKLGKP
jgi:protein-S-isoprenylcysteine O-methyltransferase Ste14